MNKMKFLLFFLIININSFAQSERTSELYKQIKEKDSLLFNVGFNTCDISQFENLVSHDFEFYHDKGGIYPSKASFIASIKNGLCKVSYQLRRQLIDSTLEVYPLNKDGVLYGAIEIGKHKFYTRKNTGQEFLDGIARFTHVWLLEDGQWKFSRGLSYDHKEIKE